MIGPSHLNQGHCLYRTTQHSNTRALPETGFEPAIPFFEWSKALGV